MSVSSNDEGLGSVMRLREVGHQQAADSGRASNLATDNMEGDDGNGGSEVGQYNVTS